MQSARPRDNEVESLAALHALQVLDTEAEAVLVPDMAVLRSGEKNTVFVALDGGKFEPRTVTIGGVDVRDFTFQALSDLVGVVYVLWGWSMSFSDLWSDTPDVAHVFARDRKSVV